MKKILAVLLCAMLVSSTAAFSAAAYESPNVKPGDTDTDPNGGDGDGDGGSKSSNPDDGSSKEGTGSDSSKGSSDGSGTGSKPGSTASTSPKTGAPVSYGVLMAAAALAFGGLAVSSRKRIDEE